MFILTNNQQIRNIKTTESSIYSFYGLDCLFVYLQIIHSKISSIKNEND